MRTRERGIGNMAFTWNTKGQNEGMWYNVAVGLLMLVPFTLVVLQRALGFMRRWTSRFAR